MVRFSVTMVDHNDIWAKLEKLFMPGLSCNNNGQHSTWKEPPCPHRSSPLPNFAVAPQLGPDDMADVAAAGYKSVIINRPDFEGGPDQPTAADVSKAARPPACGSNTSRSLAAP